MTEEYHQKPICCDLYAGLGGWADGFLAEGYRVRGYDIEAHDYGTGGYPSELILRDVRSMHGSELKDATVIVGSSPCQEFSYRAMPWKRAKALPPPYLGIELFNAQFRIQREASEAAGRYIPLIVENVRGAQKWVGQARWHFGSYYLWGDVPALMPMRTSLKNAGNGQWFPIGRDGETVENFNPVNSQIDGRKTAGLVNIRNGHTHTRHLTNQREHDAVKVPGIRLSEMGFNVAAARLVDPSNKPEGFTQTPEMKRQHIGYSRKAASAMIAKIPFPLAQHIARVYYPVPA